MRKVMDYRVNIESIQPAWRSCDYALQVWISETTVAGKRYAEEVLRKWFGGDIAYYWGNCYLAIKKQRT